MSTPIETGADVLHRRYVSDEAEVTMPKPQVADFVPEARAVLASLAQHRDDIADAIEFHARCNRVAEVLSWSCGMDMGHYYEGLVDHQASAVLAYLTGDKP